jgi:hypothetical protein
MGFPPCELGLAVECDAAILEEDGVGGLLEEDVGARVALGEFLVYFGAEIVFFVLGFPVAAREVEGVEDGGVYLEGVTAGAGDGVLGDDKLLVGAGALFEQALECAADVAFVVEVGGGAFLERGVVILDRRVVGLQLEGAHEVTLTLTRRRGRG